MRGQEPMSEERDHYSIRDAISGIFIGYGARTAPSTTDPGYLRVVLEEFKIAVGYAITDHPLTIRHIEDLLDQTADTFFHFHVFITNHPLPKDVVEFSRNNDVILIGREDLELELGKAHLGSLEVFSHPRVWSGGMTGLENDCERLTRRTVGEHENSTVAETVDERPELILVLKHYQEKNTPSPERSPSSSSIPSSSTPPHPVITSSVSAPSNAVGSQPPSSSDPAPDHGSSAQNTPSRRRQLIITPKIQLSDLPALCSAITPLTNSQMELIPYFLFAYSCTTIEERSGIRKPRTGLMAVNGVTMGVEEWEAGFSTINELPMDYIRLDPRTDQKVARDLALNGIVKVTTRVLKVKAEENGSIVSATRKIFPDTSSIQLTPEGIYFFPHWHVRSDTGSMFVDAVNGEIISKQGEDQGWDSCS